MDKSRLEIDGVTVGFDKELPISQNMAIADVREPGKANSTFTKTITIPGSPEIKKLFEFIFDVNSSLTNFNPSLKTPAKYYVNEILVFDGSLQVLRINNKFVNDYESSDFECSLIGVNANLFVDIAGLYLTDIDFSDLNHNLVYASGLFNPADLGEGYVYAYQDYGTAPSGNPRTSDWDFSKLKPLTFERDIVMRIISNAGYSVEAGGYFDSDYAKRICIPDNQAGALKMTDDQRELNECYIGKSATQSSSVYNGTVGSFINDWQFVNNAVAIAEPVEFDDESSPFFDPGNIWDEITNYRMTVNDSGYYSLMSNLVVNIVLVTAPAGAVTWETLAYSLNLEFQRSTNGGSTWTNIGNTLTILAWSDFTFNTIQSHFVSGSIPSVFLDSGDLIRVSLKQGMLGSKQSSNGIVFENNIGGAVTTGTAQIQFEIEQVLSFIPVFQAKLVATDLIYGQAVEYSQCIPQSVTQLDFLTSIMKLENLYFEPSKSVANQYIVDSREDFINNSTSDAEDWTDKWDISKPQEVIPMGELDFNRLIFKYQSDSDYYNKKYEELYKEVYGTEVIDITNDFVKKTKTIDVVFAATPLVGNSVNDIVAPGYYELNKDTNTCKPIKTKIRRLYYGGMKTCTSHTLTINGTATFPTEYPFVGHVDDSKNPTVDLCWDNPLELYWIFPGNTYTNNNRVNERWSKYLSETTDKNSKIVRMWFYLTENDIFKFTFRNLVFVKDAYYLVNKIIDYNPQAKQVTQVELLKLNAGSVFVPDNDIPLDDLGGDEGEASDRLSNTQNGTGTIVGTGNFNNGLGVVIIGDNNVVS